MTQVFEIKALGRVREDWEGYDRLRAYARMRTHTRTAYATTLPILPCLPIINAPGEGAGQIFATLLSTTGGPSAKNPRRIFGNFFLQRLCALASLVVALVPLGAQRIEQLALSRILPRKSCVADPESQTFGPKNRREITWGGIPARLRPSLFQALRWQHEP